MTLANLLICDIVVSEFDLQSRYCAYFWTNAILKGMNRFILTAMSQVVPLLFFYKDGFGIK